MPDFYDRLADLLSDPQYTPDGSELPTKDSAVKAAVILEWMADHNIHPDRIVASAEGGIALCWFRGNKYADVECLNTGEVLCVISDRKNKPIVWMVEL